MTDVTIPIDSGTFFINSMFIGLEIITIIYFGWQSIFMPIYLLLFFAQCYFFWKFLRPMLHESVFYEGFAILTKRKRLVKKID